VLRSGAYVAHDHGLYASVAPGGTGRPGPALAPALELWAQVLSRPEPGLALLCAGRRDVSFDQGLPVPLQIRRQDGEQAGDRAGAAGGAGTVAGMRVTRLDDQHAYLSVPPDAALAPGDLVALGISHPCTTFDKWRVIPVVDDEYRVVDAVHTFF
jgi:D-serine deaminase-like pyridoxal phosphate-dependent protein